MVTICLLTQGRDHLHDFLSSTQVFRSLDFVNFLIIDNGSNLDTSIIISEWAQNYPRAKYVRRERNSLDPQLLWAEIVNFAEEWIIFPGDDDSLRPEGFIEWKRIVDSNPDVQVVSTPGKIMKSSGKFTNEVLWPEFNSTSSSAIQIAQALHSPPFFWPGLFFKWKLVPLPLPNSRFVFDWWIGINLVIDANIIVSTIPAVNYRRHATQESALVSLNRKLFEAMYWIDDLLNSKKFLNWLESKSEYEKQEFWNEIHAHKPLYADDELSNLVLFSLARKLMNTNISPNFRASIGSKLGLSLGALLHDLDLQQSIDGIELAEGSFGNVRILPTGKGCETLNKLAQDTQADKFAPIQKIYCSHLIRSSSALEVDCMRYKSLPHRQALDALVQEVSGHLVSQNILKFRISPAEQKLILIARKLKSRIPRHVIKSLRKIK